MWFNKLKRYYYTLKDVGLKRIFLRIFYEVNKFIDNNLNQFFLYKIYGISNKKIDWKPVFNFNYKFQYKQNYSNDIKFSFLNITQELKSPFSWDTYEPRLWKWNLLYFSWIVDWLNLFCDKKETSQLILIEKIFDDWIIKNPIGIGDAWHSYVISLRLRNIIWAFTFFPQLISEKRINSLWDQMCWLSTHKEIHHGGNHYLENLISLSFCSLHFKGSKARSIFVKSQAELKKELELQILEDGGHEERTASYHLLLLEHLVELALTIQKELGLRPGWLLSKIYTMTSWVKKIRLIGGNFPNFNDSTISSCSDLDEVLKFALSYLNQCKYPLTGIKNKQIETLKYPDLNINKKANLFENDFLITFNKQLKYPHIIDLPDTGWTILRPGNNYELIFKCGKPCPNHLGAHVHSDLLTFDLFFDSKPLIVETGISTYERGLERNYQRSSSAHNTLQLGKNLRNGKTEWIEPIDTWHAFRAAKKADCKNRKYENFNDLLIVNGGHNAFEKIGTTYQRFLSIKLSSNSLPILIIIDSFNSKNYINLRSFMHIVPSQMERTKNKTMSFITISSNLLINEVKDGYFCNDFQIKKNNKTIITKSMVKKGNTKLVTIFTDKKFIDLLALNKNKIKFQKLINKIEESKNIVDEYEINKKLIVDIFSNFDFLL